MKTLIVSSLLCVSLMSLHGCDSGDSALIDSSDMGNSETDVFEDETANLVIPEGTNLRIDYAEPAYELIATPDYILQQWNGMKACLQVEVPDAYISIEEEVVPPVVVSDAVYSDDNEVAAIVIDRESDASFQIRVDDFLLELEDRGYFFRQIVGPYMWRFNGLDESVYDPACAAFVVR